MSNRLSRAFNPVAWYRPPAEWPEGQPVWNEKSYNTVMYGVITYLENRITGDCWWLNWNGQWLIWDYAAQMWRFVGIRTRNSYWDLGVGVVFGGLLLIFGAAFAGGAAMPFFATMAIIALVTAPFWCWLRNAHPRAYEIGAALMAYEGAKTLHKWAGHVNADASNTVSGVRAQNCWAAGQQLNASPGPRPIKWI